LRAFRLLAFAAGLALLAWLVVRSGPAHLAADLLRVGWWMVALLAIAALRNAFRTQAVRLALGPSSEPACNEVQPQFSFAALYAILLVSEAVKFVAFAGLFFGEATKGWLLNRRVSAPRAAATVMVDVLLYYLTAALFSLGAIALFFALYPASLALRRAGVAGAALLAAAVVFAAFAFRKKWLGARRLLAPLARFGLLRRPETLARIEEIDTRLFTFHQRHPAAFRAILALDFAAHLLSALEVTVILWLLGLGANFAAGIVVEGLTKLVEVGGLFVPGDIGLYQGGTGLIFHAIGSTVSTGVSAGIIRQLRSILWAALGFGFLLFPDVVRQRRETAPLN
jgi:hypothetical protein